MEKENLPSSQWQNPRIAMPQPLMMSEENSFAYLTLTQRMPAIIRRVIDENEFSREIVENLETLIQELPYGIIRLLKNQGQDVGQWNKYLEPFIGQRWIDIPWLFAEVYFYRRILEATNYFLPGWFCNVDPYALQKCRGLETSIDAIIELSALVNNWLNTQRIQDKNNLISLLYFVLWGNRADLSLWPVNAEQAGNNKQKINLAPSQILVDNTAIIAEKVSNFNNVKIDFIVDNAGFELVCDLCLADFLLATHRAGIIYLHLKYHPTFVSDATIRDVNDTLEFLSQNHNPEIKSLAHRLQNYLAQGCLVCCAESFWTFPLMFWEMPQTLQKELAQSSLIIIKGDANYRRTLGDRQWEFTTSFEEIACYFPAPFVALRTLKSELAVGLQLEQIKMLNKEDPHWLTNGQWGVIQFVE